MRIRIDFGQSGPRKELNWYQDVDDFPTLLRKDGKKWEFLMYDKDKSGQYDMIFTFVELPTYDPNFYADCPDFDEMFGLRSRTGCECGAIHTSFPQIHMFFCPMWRKI